MIKLLFGLIILVLAVGCGDGFEKKKPSQQNTQEGQRVDTFTVNQNYLQLLNDHRIGLGLRPVTYNSIVEEISKSHSKGMALHTRTFGHMGFSLRCRRLKNRLGKIRKCGEIVSMGQKTVRDVFNAWLNSPKHRSEIEQASYTHTGLGIYEDESGVTYWTQMFIEL